MEQTFDRSQFKGVSQDTYKEQIEEQKALAYSGSGNSDRVPFLSIKEGSNVRRIYPPHPGEKFFSVPKMVSWLPITIWVFANDEKKECYTPTEEQISKGEVKQTIKRKPIFNSRIHSHLATSEEGVAFSGILFKDIVEAYIAYATKEIEEQMNDVDKTDKKKYKEILDKKLGPIVDWKQGIKGQTSYIFYADEIKADGTRVFGRQEYSNGIRVQMNQLSKSNKGGQAIMVDVFSDPDTGKALQIDYNPNEPDNKKKYTTALLWQQDWTLTDAQLQVWSEHDSLQSIYENSFKRSDFNKQLVGLQNFDSQHKFNYFSHTDWQDIVVKFDALFPDDEGQGSNDSDENSENNQEESTTSTSKEKSFTNPIELMERDTLLKFIEFAKLDLSPKDRHDDNRVIADIMGELEEVNFKGLTKTKFEGEVKDLVEDFYAFNKANSKDEPSTSEEPEVVKENINTKDAVDDSKTKTGVSDLKAKYAKKSADKK